MLVVVARERHVVSSNCKTDNKIRNWSKTATHFLAGVSMALQKVQQVGVELEIWRDHMKGTACAVTLLSVAST
jgi:hypothetical protein